MEPALKTYLCGLITYVQFYGENTYEIFTSWLYKTMVHKMITSTKYKRVYSSVPPYKRGIESEARDAPCNVETPCGDLQAIFLENNQD